MVCKPRWNEPTLYGMMGWKISSHFVSNFKDDAADDIECTAAVGGTSIKTK